MTPITSDLTTLSDPQLAELLGRLEHEEQTVSRRRTALHDRIGFLGSGGFASAHAESDELQTLLETERELSSRRHELHRLIEELRLETGRRRRHGVS